MNSIYISMDDDDGANDEGVKKDPRTGAEILTLGIPSAHADRHLEHIS